MLYIIKYKFQIIFIFIINQHNHRIKKYMSLIINNDS